jgi:hypothetical protein
MKKNPSVALSSPLVIAEYLNVHLISQGFGCLASGHFLISLQEMRFLKKAMGK